MSYCSVRSMEVFIGELTAKYATVDDLTASRQSSFVEIRTKSFILTWITVYVWSYFVFVQTTTR